MAMGNLASYTGCTRTTRASGTVKGKKCPAKDQANGTCVTQKKREVKLKEFIDTDEVVKIVMVGPFKDKGQQRHILTPSEESEEPKVLAPLCTLPVDSRS